MVRCAQRPSFALLAALAGVEPALASPSVELSGPGRLIPDVSESAASPVAVLHDGTRCLVVSGMRILDHPDGSLERAREILPSAGGPPRVLELPLRLGGGFLFWAIAGDATRIWRTSSYLGELSPVAEVPGRATEIVAGFDRLYVTLSGEVKAIDLETGNQVIPLPLPAATTVGQHAFADAWRAVAVVDYRGALATFDAGNSWRPIPLAGQNVSRLSMYEGSFLIEAGGKRYRLGPGGELVSDDPSSATARLGPADVPPVSPAAPAAYELGRRALRAAIESGFPSRGQHGERTAIFAQSRTLYRVALETTGGHALGTILDSKKDAYAEEGGCLAVPLANSFGFICDVPGGGSAVYRFESPFGMRETLRFERPRNILVSGNGGIVIAGSCARNEWGMSGAAAAYCFVPAGSDAFELAVPDMNEADRALVHAIVMADGTPVLLVAPRSDSGGRLLVGRGFDKKVPLVMGEYESWLKRAFVRNGVEELAPGELGGFAQLGNELRGFRIGLDGKVRLAPVAVGSARTVVSGRYAFEWGTAGRGLESTDGGMTWAGMELPAYGTETASNAVAGAGPVGASEGATRDGRPSGWLRIGWGSDPGAPDLLPAPEPSASRTSLVPARLLSMRCEPTGVVSGPASGGPLPAARRPTNAPQLPPVIPNPPALGPARLPPIFHPTSFGPIFAVDQKPTTVPEKWSSFRGSPAPVLRADETGVEAGTDSNVAAQARLYVWGARGADWTRAGHLQVRFDDRFDVAGVRTTAITPAFWSDRGQAIDALGLGSNQTASFWSVPDAGGDATVLIEQRGPGRVELFGAAAGEPLLAWRDAAGGALPMPSSAARIGPTWFFLSSTSGANASTWLYRVDGGVARRLVRFARLLSPPQGEPLARIVRRAKTRRVALFVAGARAFGRVARDWYVLPIDEETGELEEAVRLVGSDLEGAIPPRCEADQDGWLVTPDMLLPPVLRTVSADAATMSSIEIRLRLDPGVACVDAMAAHIDGLVTNAHPNKAIANSTGDTVATPLAATDTSSGRRWLLRCNP